MPWGNYGGRAGVIAITLVLQLCSSVCVGLRFYTRLWKRQVILASDWLIMGAFICGSGLSIMEIYGVMIDAFVTPLNSTNPAVQGRSQRLKNAQHLEYAFVIIGVFSIGVVKLSVCLLYLHIFTACVNFRRLLLVWTTIVALWTVTFVLAELLECGAHPLKVFGTRHDIETYCPHIHDIGYALVGSDAATDLITLLIPIPVVWTMKLPTSQKILVGATFFIGILAVGASTAKAYIYIAATKRLIYEDGIVLLTTYSIWNLVEIHIGIVAACGMTLRPILRRILPVRKLWDYARSRWGWRRSENRNKGNDLPSFVKVVSNADTDPPTPLEKPGQSLAFQTSAIPEVV